LVSPPQHLAARLTLRLTPALPPQHRASTINHNLRHIDWPHGYGDPNAYYHKVGQRHWSGPMVLRSEHFEALAASPALFARKV
jgi:hypothetical protein